MSMKTAGLTLGLLGSLLLLPACQKKPPQGAVIAVLNGEEITIDELRAELKGLPIPDMIDRQMLARAALQDLINRKVLVQQARKQGYDKSPAYLAQLKRGEEDIMADILGHSIALQVPVPQDTEIRNYIDAHPAQFGQRQLWSLNQIRFAIPKDRRKLDVLKDAHTLDAAAAALQTVGIASAPGTSQIDTGEVDPTLLTEMQRVPPGEPMLLPQGDGMVVAVVTAKTPQIAPEASQKVAAARAVRAEALLHESQAQVASMRVDAKISYQPGFEPKPARK